MDIDTEHSLYGKAIAQQNFEVSSNLIGTKRKRASHSSVDIPWTASRCNRLLRTITSRVNTLQRLATSHGLEKNTTKYLDSTVKPDRTTAGHHEAAAATIGISPSKDPEWYPQPKNDHIARTYGGKTKPKERKLSPRPNDTLSSSNSLGISTPFVKRMLRPDLLSASSKKKAGLFSSSDYAERKVSNKRKTRRQLPIKPSSAAAEAYISLGNALSSFLRATNPKHPGDRSGAPSLMSACLRRAPAYVDLERECSGRTGDALFDETEESCDSIYEDLEGLGTAQGSGWSGLREVVRADGLSRIQQAIRTGLLPMSIIIDFANTCCAENALVEGQQLLCTSLEARLPGRRQALKKLLDVAENYTCGGSTLRRLTDLLVCGFVTVHDLTVQTEVWRVFFRAIALSCDRAEAVEFLNTYMLTAWKRGFTQGSACDHHVIRRDFRGVAVLLTAMASSRYEPGEAFQDSLDHDLRRLAVHAALIEVDSNQHLEENHARTQYDGSLLSPFLLSGLILEVGGREDLSTIQRLDVEMLARLLGHSNRPEYTKPVNAQLQSGLDFFISDVAICVARWNQEASDNFLSETIRKLLRTSESLNSPPATTMINDLALGSAKAYAESRGDKGSVIFAEEVEEMVLHGARVLTPITPGAPGSNKDRYRWEEGLCEWIARTPFSMVATTNRAGGPSSACITHCATVASDYHVPKPVPLTAFHRVFDTKCAARKHRVTKRAIVELDGVSHARQQIQRQKMQCQRRDPRMVATMSDDSDTQTDLSDELDELAFSVKRRAPPKLVVPELVRKATGVESRQVELLKRASSGSSGWSTLDDSGDELGIESGDELGM